MKNTTYGDEINQTQVNTSALELLTSEDKVSAYNSTTYENSSMTTESKGSQTDTTGYNKGEQINTNDKNRTTEATLIRKGKVSGASAESLIKEHLESSLNGWDLCDRNPGDNEVEDGWFWWALKGAVANAGYYDTAVNSDNFYKKVEKKR